MYANDRRKNMVFTLEYLEAIYMVTTCHHFSSLNILYDKIILSKKDKKKGKLVVSLLIDNRFLVKFGTTRISFNLREGVRESRNSCE